jgi:hypothetical protein
MKILEIGGLLAAISLSFGIGIWVNNIESNQKQLEARVEKMGSAVTIPSGLVAYFDAPQCPAGWNKKESVQGRYIVGTTTNGTLGSQVGQPLKDKENRPTGQHTHGFDDQSIGYAKGTPEGLGTEFNSQSNVDIYFEARTTKSVAEPDIPAGTNAPYVQFLACEKI